MTLHSALRFEAAPGPAAMMRLFTIILAVTMVILGALAAHHHAQVAQGEITQAVIAEFDTAPLPLAERAGSPDSTSEHLMLGLATGCIVLIAYCTLGLALLAARAWRAELLRRLNAVAQSLCALIIGPPPTTLATIAPPSLVALSISRT